MAESLTGGGPARERGLARVNEYPFEWCFYFTYTLLLIIFTTHPAPEVFFQVQTASRALPRGALARMRLPQSGYSLPPARHVPAIAPRRRT
jgi:hypothetical protein